MSIRLSVRLLALALAVIVLAACGGTAEETDTTAEETDTTAEETDTTAATEDTDEIQTYRTVASGVPGVGRLHTLLTYEALRLEGIDIEETYLSSGEGVFQALTRGDADFAFHAPPGVTATGVLETDEELLIASGMVTNEFVLGGTTEIDSIEDLNGQRVGIHAETGGSAALNSALIDKYDLDYETLIIPNSPARAEAIVQDQLDAAVLDMENALALIDTDPSQYHIIVQFGEEFGSIESSGGFTAPAAFYDENPELVQTIINTYIETTRRMFDDPDWAAEQGIRYFGLNYEDREDQLRDLVKEYIDRGLWDPNGGLTETSAQATMEFFANYGDVPADAAENWEQFFDFTYVNRALEELGEY